MKLKEFGNSRNEEDLLTINGVKKRQLIWKSFELAKCADVYFIVKENIKWNFLICLNLIKKFKLIRNEYLKITLHTNTK